MKLTTLEKIFKCLRDEKPQILIEDKTLRRAKKPIVRMMKISEKLGL